MAGHAIAIADGFPSAQIIGVEPDTADDFRQSLEAGECVRVDHPTGICDGLLSYDVDAYNWPILKEHVTDWVVVPDSETQQAMKWLYENHGLRAAPSGAITAAAVFQGRINLDGDGDLVIVVSGRNLDESQFQAWIT